MVGGSTSKYVEVKLPYIHVKQFCIGCDPSIFEIQYYIYIFNNEDILEWLEDPLQSMWKLNYHTYMLSNFAKYPKLCTSCLQHLTQISDRF